MGEIVGKKDRMEGKKRDLRVDDMGNRERENVEKDNCRNGARTGMVKRDVKYKVWLMRSPTISDS